MLPLIECLLCVNPVLSPLWMPRSVFILQRRKRCQEVEKLAQDPAASFGLGFETRSDSKVLALKHPGGLLGAGGRGRGYSPPFPICLSGSGSAGATIALHCVQDCEGVHTHVHTRPTHLTLLFTLHTYFLYNPHPHIPPHTPSFAQSPPYAPLTHISCQRIDMSCTCKIGIAFCLWFSNLLFFMKSYHT